MPTRRESAKQLATKDAEIARCHEAICCLTGEVERLRSCAHGAIASDYDAACELLPGSGGNQLAARVADLIAEAGRLRGVIRNMRAERRDVELCNRHLLAGFAWTAETEAFIRQEWDRETERLCGGAE
jgi:hypothetical protein